MVTRINVRSFVNLPEIGRGQTGTLPDDARTRGLLANGLVERLTPSGTPIRRPARAPEPPAPTPAPSDVATDVPSGTVREILDWVGDDVGRAAVALDRELRSTPSRSTLVGRLLDLVDTYRAD